MTRPRRAILPESGDAEQPVAHVPRRSSEFVPAADPDPPPVSAPEVVAEPDADENRPPPRPRRALPALPDPDPEGPDEAVQKTRVRAPLPPVPVPERTRFAPEPAVPLASPPSPDESDESVARRPGRAWIAAEPDGGDDDDEEEPATVPVARRSRAWIEPQEDLADEEPATVPVARRPARAWVDPEPTPAPEPPPTAPPPPPVPAVTRTGSSPRPVTSAPPGPPVPVRPYAPIPTAPRPTAYRPSHPTPSPTSTAVQAPAPAPRPAPNPATGPAPTPTPRLVPTPPPTPAARPTPSSPATPTRTPAPAATPPNPVPRPLSMTRPSPGQRPTPTPERRPASKRRGTRQVEPIVIDRLVKAYNGVLAVRNLSFEVEPGRITGFLGPNGAGKTTTLRILVGLVAPTTGSATFGGTAYADLAKPQETVGAVLDAKFHPGRSGRNHLRVLAATAGVGDRRVDDVLERVGLTEHARRPAGQYSLGMRQRLALAAALIGNPDYLILDEPANGLDPEGIRWLRQFLRDFTSNGRAVLVSSHLLNEVQATVDEIVVIHKGRLLTQMPMSELQLGQGTTRARVSDLDHAGQVLAPLGVRLEWAVDERGPYLRVHSQEVAAVGAALFDAGIVVHELVTERRDLEQEFFSMLEASR